MDVVKRPYVAAVSGVKNSGKTTFLEKLIPVLTARGYQVAVIKHDGHEFEADVEGRDTFRLKEAGAYGCGIFSGSRFMVVKDDAGIDERKMLDLFPEADVILLEGMKNSSYPKFEIVRRGVSTGMVCAKETLLGLVTDTGLCLENVPVLALEDVQACADILEENMNRCCWNEEIL